MAKFIIGQKVGYAGGNKALGLHLRGGLKVIDIIPDGLPIGNGETNRSGENIYRLRNELTGIIYNLQESELEAL